MLVAIEATDARKGMDSLAQGVWVQSVVRGYFAYHTFRLTGEHWGFGPSAPGYGTEPSAVGVRKPDSPGSV
jgi:hypothetical protein